MYYIYAYINPNTGLPFYVGKGCGIRAYAQNERSVKWFEKANGGYWVEIIAQDLEESIALLIEQSLIKGLNPGLTNSKEVKEVIDQTRYLFNVAEKVEQNSIQIEKNKNKINKLKKQLSNLELTKKEKEFLNSNLAMLPARLLSAEDLSFRAKIALKLKKQRVLQEKLGNIY
jgi:hypothetical protein